MLDSAGMRRALPILIVLTLLGAVPSSGSAADSLGRDFWLGFPDAEDAGSPAYQLRITAPAAASGTVAVPGTSFSQGFTVAPGSATTVNLPTSVEQATANAVGTGHAVHVTSDQDVAVQARVAESGVGDGYLGLPTELLGNAYRVLDYPGNATCGKAEFEIVGTQADTTVTIDPKVALVGRAAGAPYEISLDAGSTYLGKAAGTDATTGTGITADKPIAVLGANTCAQIPVGTSYANHLVEQLPPISAWGTDFSLLPFAGRTSGDQVTVLGSVDGTSLAVSSAGGSVPGAPATLDAGVGVTFAIDEPVRVIANQPILVAHFAEGLEAEDPGAPSPTGDPTMVLVPPRERWAYSQTVSTPATGFSQNYLNVAIATADLGSLRLDGALVSPGLFSPLPGSPAVSGGRLAIGSGAHALTSDGPFGVEVYGFDPSDAFGWAGAWGDGSRAPLPPPATSTDLPGQPLTIAPLSAQVAIAKCRVPKLKRKKLAAAKKILRRSGCRLGKVKKRDGATAKTGRVVKQKPGAGKTLAAGAKVSVVLDA